MRPNDAQHSPPPRGEVAAPLKNAGSHQSGADGANREPDRAKPQLKTGTAAFLPS